MSSDTALLIVIGFLAILQFLSVAVIAYLAKKVIEDKPVAIKENTQAGVPPTVVTRADLRVARQLAQEENLADRNKTVYTDIDSMPPELAMEELDRLGRTQGEI